MFGRGQHVGRVGTAIDQRSELEEDRSGNVRGLVFGARIATRFERVLGGVDHPQIARVELSAKPFGGYETVHRMPSRCVMRD